KPARRAGPFASHRSPMRLRSNASARPSNASTTSDGLAQPRPCCGQTSCPRRCGSSQPDSVTSASALVRRLRDEDRAEHVRMRVALWPDEDTDDLAAEFDKLLTEPDQVAFVAERAERTGRLCGMVE